MSSLARRLILSLNVPLSWLNLKLESRTADRIETARLARARDAGWFDRPVFSVPPAFESGAWGEIVEALSQHEARFQSFSSPASNDTGFSWTNPYYTSPDAEVLYTLLRLRQPRLIIETGCGNSTRVTRQAVKDGAFPSRIVCIDPHPREVVASLADEFIKSPVEAVDPAAIASRLEAGDVFFIDTSHQCRPANDVAFLFCTILPLLAPGVIVHIHDVFIPYDYPAPWLFERDLALDWGENYLAHALVSGGGWDVLWAGHHLQRSQPDFGKWFPRLGQGRAQSLWLVKK